MNCPPDMSPPDMRPCELSMFKLYSNVSFVQVSFEYVLLFSMHDMTDSFVIYKYC